MGIFLAMFIHLCITEKHHDHYLGLGEGIEICGILLAMFICVIGKHFDKNLEYFWLYLLICGIEKYHDQHLA